MSFDGQPEDWVTHRVVRYDAPPIRFSGRRISHVESRQWPGIAVTLWEKRRSGFVVEHSVPIRVPPKTTTFSVRTIPDAVAGLEEYCSEVQEAGLDLPENPPVSLDPTLMLLLERLTVQSQVSAFVGLSGRAIAHWYAQHKFDN
ncbi:MAG: hypothetical protein AAF748_05645 [Pseudomonadota bacterium]